MVRTPPSLLHISKADIMTLHVFLCGLMIRGCWFMRYRNQRLWIPPEQRDRYPEELHYDRERDFVPDCCCESLCVFSVRVGANGVHLLGRDGMGRVGRVLEDHVTSDWRDELEER